MKKHNLLILTILLLFLTTGCGKKSIIGKWKSYDTKDEYYYIFNKDNTCSYEMTVARLDCTYEINEDQLTILYNGNEKANNFKYRFDGEILIIKDENNNYSEFIKQKEK